jgi:hypothetical protein
VDHIYFYSQNILSIAPHSTFLEEPVDHSILIYSYLLADVVDDAQVAYEVDDAQVADGDYLVQVLHLAVALSVRPSDNLLQSLFFTYCSAGYSTI